MIKLTGVYYDGESSNSNSATLLVENKNAITLEVEGIEQALGLQELKISPRVANIKRSIYFSHGGEFVCSDNDKIDLLSKQLGLRAHNSILYKIENYYKYILLCLGFAILLCLFLYYCVIPVLAHNVALMFKPAVLDEISLKTLKQLDKNILKSSMLPQARQNELTEKFKQFSLGLPEQYSFQLLFRKGNRLGANALALPSGIIVVSDELVDFAQTDEELLAIIAHEIGHVVHRHGVEAMLQYSLIAALMIFITGDVTAGSSLYLGLLTVLVESQYSQQAEYESDVFALKYLKAKDIPLKHFINIMQRIQQKHKSAGAGVLQYFSSHPATEDRLELLNNYVQ